MHLNLGAGFALYSAIIKAEENTNTDRVAQYPDISYMSRLIKRIICDEAVFWAGVRVPNLFVL